MLHFTVRVLCGRFSICGCDSFPFGLRVGCGISFILFNELKRFRSEIETDNLTVSNSEIIILDFTV